MCLIVPYQSTHRDGVLSVVQDVHREYRFSWEADGYHRDLYEIEKTYLEPGGMFWALVNGRHVIGCTGVTIHDRHRPTHDPQGEEPLRRNPSLVFSELHRLYILQDCRGQGWGQRMLETSIDFARARGATRMIAWSDVILTNAHALYQKNGFVVEGQRICNDPDKSREHGLWKEPL